MRWLEKIEKSFILLSNHRKLYHGNVGRPLKYVMDDVDAGTVDLLCDLLFDVLSHGSTEGPYAR